MKKARAAMPTNDQKRGLAADRAKTPPPDDLGQEGAQSTIKPNTTGKGERQDRGP